MKSEPVVEPVTAPKAKGKRKSKNKRKNAKINEEKDIDREKKSSDTINEEKEASKNIDKEIGKINENICLVKDSSSNDVCKETNKELKDSNNLEEVNNTKDRTVTFKQVNEIMDIVTDTIHSVSEAIDTVNEAIKTDGMDDLINQMENLTGLGGVSADNAKNSEIINEISTENAGIGDKSVNDNLVNTSIIVETENLDNLSTEDIKNPTVTESENLDTQNDSTKDLQNTKASRKVTIADTKRNLDNHNPIPTESGKIPATEIPTLTEPANSETRSKEEAYCNKCFVTKIEGVCLCSNVNLYMLLGKGSKDGKKNGGECEGAASVDLSSAIALINR